MNNSITPVSIQPQTSINETKGTTPRRFISTQSVDRVEKIGGTNPMEKPTKMLLSMLRGALSDEPVDMEVFKGSNYADWAKMLDIANEASVTGMALDASKKMPKGTIPKGIELKMSEVQREAAVRHGEQEKILSELTEMYAQKGIETIQLKGIGLSMDYPEPTRRFGGDIDIFTRLKGTETQSLGHSNSYGIVDDMMADMGLEVEDHHASKKTKHSEFDYNGVRIENHRYFINKERMPEAEALDDFLHRSINPRERILPHGTKILVPSKEFNSVFLAHHAFQHYVFSGIDLHHLTDWAMHIKENGLQLPPETKGTNFEKFTYALTNLSNRYLGTDVKVPEDRKYEDAIFEKLLHPEVEKPPEGMNKMEILLYKTKRFFRTTTQTSKYTGESVTKTVLKTIISKFQDSSTLFKV
ncbi:MAG: nucleotidyltransferase family protein [Candidatus Gastranaerophilales bacterium]|nr:nucleotidyltransferase family protein [Candidatus Gastranaerophilales bacterium]